jgi:hypothetical protein
MATQTSSAVQNIIAILNSNNPNILSVQKFMLLAHIQRAAKLGDVHALRYMALCELNVHTATRH